MIWLLVGITVWIALAVPLAVVVGRTLRHGGSLRTQRWPVPGDLPVEQPPSPGGEEPEVWTGPATVPFAPSRLPWGGDRVRSSRRKLPVVRHPVAPAERDPSRTRDSGIA